MRRVLVVIASLAVAASACGSDPAEGKFGEELFDAVCAACHGEDGSGGGAFPAINAGSDAISLTDAQIAGVIRAGPGAMPSFQRRLTSDQIDSVVAYVRRLQGAR